MAGRVPQTVDVGPDFVQHPARPETVVSGGQ
jgi:hypothetical protein